MRRGSRQRDDEFVAFTAEHRQGLLRTATLLCAGDAATAEDLVQTTLTSLYLSWSKVRSADSPLAYARTSLTHAFIDEMRRAHRRRESRQPWADTEHEPAGNDPDPSLRDTILAALATLGPRQRAVVVLRHWLDLDVDSTARLLGCSPGTVKSQNARALAHLRATLGEIEPDLVGGCGLMDDPTRLRRALEEAAPETTATDPTLDLARARTALRTRSRRRLRLGLSALAIVVVAGVGLAAVVDRPGSEDPSATQAQTRAPITLVATTLHAAPYSFDLTPKGWSVQARSAYVVTIVPDHGHVSPDPLVFLGKLVISFDHERPTGELLAGGWKRAIWVGSSTGYTTMSMRTTGAEPRGVVEIQYPDHAGWGRSSMARFLLSVHVGPGVRASQG